jgi:hypothetical protein
MRYPRSRKTLVASNRQVHQGMIAIVGRLVVLSVFMLVLGVTRTTAQTGRDERCAAYTGQAHGLCTAAVSEGCFDPGVASQECDDLTTNWNERCTRCEGAAPWTVACPCANTSAVQLNELFEGLTFDGSPVVVACRDDGAGTLIHRRDSAGICCAPEIRVLSEPQSGGCEYRLTAAPGQTIVLEVHDNLTGAESAACRADILVLQIQFPDDCP